MDEVRALLQRFRERSLTLSTAESCTGGLLGAMITAVPGSSDVYKGGVISYCNEVKHRILDVPETILSQYGAVSWQTAEAMARGARAACRADIGVGITGLAGPEGDGSGLPVGLVFIGYSDAKQTTYRKLSLSGSREEIRRQACAEAVSLIRSLLP